MEKNQVSRARLKEALAAGTMDRSSDERRAQDAATARVKEVDKKFNDAVAQWREWLAPRIYGLIREATRQRKGYFNLGMSDLDESHTTPWEAKWELVRALESFEGIRGEYYSEETNMQDSSAPCWETHHFVSVRWETAT